MHPLISRKRLILLTVILLPVLLYVFRIRLLVGMADFLVIHDKIEPADIVFLLNGDTTTRPNQAAALIHQGLAPKVVIARVEDSKNVELGAYPNPTDTMIVVLRKLGLEESQIVQLLISVF